MLLHSCAFTDNIYLLLWEGGWILIKAGMKPAHKSIPKKYQRCAGSAGAACRATEAAFSVESAQWGDASGLRQGDKTCKNRQCKCNTCMHCIF